LIQIKTCIQIQSSVLWSHSGLWIEQNNRPI